MFNKTELIEKLFECDNDLDRFDILAMAALGAPKYPDGKKTDEYRVRSCETNTWFCCEGGEFFAESDSLFVKGLCLALIDATRGLPDKATDIGFADECFERGIITKRRRDGLYGVEVEIIKYLNIKNGENQNEKSH